MYKKIWVVKEIIPFKGLIARSIGNETNYRFLWCMRKKFKPNDPVANSLD